jgi:hypothetical protein
VGMATVQGLVNGWTWSFGVPGMHKFFRVQVPNGPCQLGTVSEAQGCPS